LSVADTSKLREPGFLAQKRVVWEALFDRASDQQLGFDIGFADAILRAFAADTRRRTPPKVA
jgi:hypothetical protein